MSSNLSLWAKTQTPCHLFPKLIKWEQVREHRSAEHLLTLHSFTLVKNLERISLLAEIFTQKDYRNPSLLNEVINTFLQQINISISQMRIKSQRLSYSHYEVSGTKAAVPLSSHPGKQNKTKQVTFLSPVKIKKTATLSTWGTNSKQTTQNLVKITKQGELADWWERAVSSDAVQVVLIGFLWLCSLYTSARSATSAQQEQRVLWAKKSPSWFVLESRNPIRGCSHGLEDNFFCWAPPLFFRVSIIHL